LIKPVDPVDPGVADKVADWAALDGTVGVRLMLTRGASEDPADPGINRFWRPARSIRCRST
jgi:L-fuconolactonase